MTETFPLSETVRRIEVFLDVDEEYRFRIVGDNNTIIAQSQGYGKKDDMMDTVNKYFPEWVVKGEIGE